MSNKKIVTMKPLNAPAAESPKFELIGEFGEDTKQPELANFTFAIHSIDEEGDVPYIYCSEEDGKTLYDYLRYNKEHHIAKLPIFNVVNDTGYSYLNFSMYFGSPVVDLLEIEYNDTLHHPNCFIFAIIIKGGEEGEEYDQKYLLNEDGVFEILTEE